MANTGSGARRGFPCLCPCGERLGIDVEDVTVRCRGDCDFVATVAELRRLAEGYLALADWLETAPPYPEGET